MDNSMRRTLGATIRHAYSLKRLKRSMMPGNASILSRNYTVCTGLDLSLRRQGKKSLEEQYCLWFMFVTGDSMKAYVRISTKLPMPAARQHS